MRIIGKARLTWLGGCVIIVLFGAFIGHAGAQCVPAPSGLVSWWPGEGNAEDIISGNNGTLQNGATITSGFVGDAFSFDGFDDYLIIPDSRLDGLFESGADFSITVWALD